LLTSSRRLLCFRTSVSSGTKSVAQLTEQLFTRDHALEMTQAQLAHTEAQRFALVQNMAEMQNQVAEMEIEVEVW
jgi:urocanate hydratase